MLRKIKILISYKLEQAVEEWLKIFVRKELYRGYSEIDIEQLFRGFNKNYSKKDFLRD